MSAQFTVLANGNLHMNHGPIDLILQIDGAWAAVESGRQRAWERFETILDELVGELPVLRSGNPAHWGKLQGSIARRMAAAVSGAVSSADVFITPMAAVAGSVADEIVQVFAGKSGIKRAIINNGGDIAIYLAAGEICRVGIVSNPVSGEAAGSFWITADENIRGVATSGWRGRSQSLGIADAVTILGATAAEADAMATLVANAVDLPGHGQVVRQPATAVKADSDLGERLVTVDVGALSRQDIANALDRGAQEAHRLKAAGRLTAAVLCLAGEVRVIEDGNRLKLSA